MLKSVFKQLIILPLVLASTAVLATTYSFTQITSNGNTDVSSQLSVDVTASGSNVLFTFYNAVGLSSSVTDIYFDYGNTNFFSSLSNDILGATGDSAGVSFSDGASPPVLPAGNNVDPDFVVSFAADSDAPTAPNGVDAASEYVSLLGTTLAGITFADVLAGIDSGNFRIGLHVQSIDQVGGGDESESYVNTVNAVPIPAAGWLFGSALLAFMGLSRRKL
jgi:hypothetical protein